MTVVPATHRALERVNITESELRGLCPTPMYCSKSGFRKLINIDDRPGFAPTDLYTHNVQRGKRRSGLFLC
jgi:hypothetical protein